MERFDDERPELTGSLISLEFGPGGRISSLWASDPNLAEEGDEFQFILPPIQFGEEVSDDYLPGTILLGARTGPRDPWILDRNTRAKNSASGEEIDALFDPTQVGFEYEFPLLEDYLSVTGNFSEQAGTLPQILWDIEIKNHGRRSIEIGELAFPFALNNFYDGFGWTDAQLQRLWTSRVYLHKYIGGAASWLFAQRMTAEPPGLLILPGTGTEWEFYTHVKASLNTPHQWEGIPVVYVHSRAAVEREEWEAWNNGHTSLILEPGDSRKFQTRFVPADSDRHDGLAPALLAAEKPSIKVFPACVAPAHVGIGIEIQGKGLSKFSLSREVMAAIDQDEETAFAFIQPETPGPVSISFLNKEEKVSYAHFQFIEPLRDLIHKRADWISKNQRVVNPESPLHHALVLTSLKTGKKVEDAAEYSDSSGLECALADALYLAEKNTIYPDAEQIEILNAFVKDFLLDDIQNPASHALGSSLMGEGTVAGYFGRPLGYPHAFNLYHSLARIAGTYGGTLLSKKEALEHGAKTALAMFEQGWRLYVRTVGVLGFARIHDLISDLREEEMDDLADQLEESVTAKAEELVKMKYPFAGESVMDTSGFEDVFASARHLMDDDHLERTVRCFFATRSMAPSWWWYGSDKRSYDGADSSPIKALFDRGEACLAHTTIPNSLIFFGLMDRDYLGVPDAYVRMAFGGMLAPWALVRADGAASMCYCPDSNSKQAGFNEFTGASGLGYYHYLRGTGSYVLPNKGGFYSFGCHFDADPTGYVVRPWDGVGRKIVLRQIGVSLDVSFGVIQEMKLDPRLRWFELKIENPSDKLIRTKFTISGLWGREIEVAGVTYLAEGGKLVFEADLPPKMVTELSGKVVSP